MIQHMYALIRAVWLILSSSTLVQKIPKSMTKLSNNPPALSSKPCIRQLQAIYGFGVTASS